MYKYIMKSLQNKVNVTICTETEAKKSKANLISQLMTYWNSTQTFYSQLCTLFYTSAATLLLILYFFLYT